MPAAPNYLASARGTPGHESDPELVSDFNHRVQAYLRTAF